MSFLPMALPAFQKAFGLQEIRKGFFSHFFNTAENQSYTGPIPAVDSYDPEVMSVERKQEFLKWHQERKAEGYDFQHEILEYCKSDVRLLKESCRCFQDEFLQAGRIQPHAILHHHCFSLLSLLPENFLRTSQKLPPNLCAAGSGKKSLIPVLLREATLHRSLFVKRNPSEEHTDLSKPKRELHFYDYYYYFFIAGT